MSLSARTASDYAIEHGGYLARSVTAFLDLIGREAVLDEDAQQHLREEVADHLQAMRSGVYEFEKRAARAEGVALQQANAYAEIHREQLARPSLNGRQHEVRKVACDHCQRMTVVPVATNSTATVYGKPTSPLPYQTALVGDLTPNIPPDTNNTKESS